MDRSPLQDVYVEEDLPLTLKYFDGNHFPETCELLEAMQRYAESPELFSAMDLAVVKRFFAYSGKNIDGECLHSLLHHLRTDVIDYNNERLDENLRPAAEKPF
jgi:hypothetical protein